MTLEIIGVVVHKLRQVVHQFAEGGTGGEGGDDREEARIAASEDANSAGTTCRQVGFGRGSPEALAVIVVEGRQFIHAKQLEHRLLVVLNGVEARGRSGQEHEARLALQGLAECPGLVVTHLRCRGPFAGSRSRGAVVFPARRRNPSTRRARVPAGAPHRVRRAGPGECAASEDRPVWCATWKSASSHNSPVVATA